MAKGFPISFRLEMSEKAALEAAAEKDARSVSSLLTLIVREWLRAQADKKG